MSKIIISGFTKDSPKIQVEIIGGGASPQEVLQAFRAFTGFFVENMVEFAPGTTKESHMAEVLGAVLSALNDTTGQLHHDIDLNDFIEQFKNTKG